MAVFYTDFLNGDDTTGDGTWATPYKTIYKATQTISANDDEVRVKGSGWTDLPGTITLTNGSTYTAITSDDLTSFFPELSIFSTTAKVVITIDDEWGIGKSVITAVAVSNGSLNLGSVWAGKTGTYSLKRLTTQHYYATSNPTSPTGVSGYWDAFDFTNMLNYTGLQVTGGWTADGVRDGMTAFVNAFGNQLSSLYRGISGSVPASSTNHEKTSTWYYAGFAGINILSFNLDNALAQMGDFWFVRSNQQFGVSNALMWNKTGETPNFYMYDCSGDTSARWLGEGNGEFPLFNVNIWHSVCQVTISSGNRSFCGNGKIFNELHLRGQTSGAGSIINSTGGYFFYSSYSRATIVDKFYFYKSNITNYQYFALGTGFDEFNYFKINKVYIPDYGQPSSVYLTPTFSGTSTEPTQGAWYIGDGTQSLAELTVGNMGNPSNQDFNTNIISARGFVVNSTDGQYRWVVNGNNDAVSILVGESNDFVTGTNALKLKFNKVSAGLTPAPNYRVPLAVLPNITTPKTLTIKAKAEAATVGSYNVTLWTNAPTGFGRQLNPAIMQNLGWLDLTTTYQDFVFSIDPATWPTYTAPYPQVYYVYIQYTAGIDSYPGDILIDSIELS